MSRRAAFAAAGALALLLVAAPAAHAHGLVGRADLPIPTWLFAWAAAIVLVASFVALAALWPRSRLQEPRDSRLFRIPATVDVLCGAIGIGLFVLVVYSGLAGTKEATSNFAPNFIYVHFWVGLVVLSVLFGDVFRAFNPWRAFGHGVAWIAGRFAPGGLPEPLEYPRWLGRWPAVVGILGFAWLELAYTYKSDPHTLALLALGYAAVQLVAMSVFGTERWGEHGDAFGVYFSLFSRLSPFTRRNGVLHVRPPLNGAPRLPILPGSVALLCAAIGSTTFDGFSNGSIWASLGPDLQRFFTNLGASAPMGGELANTVGLIAAVLVVAAFYHLGIRGMKTVGEGHSVQELAERFGHTLIPIAFAYALAHYFSLLVYQGQSAAYLISDPLGDGSNLFGTGNATINYGVISATGIWYVQVGALVCGHVAGLVLAHDRALAIYTRTSEAVRSQYWMLVVMVGFTSLGLWLLSAVNR